MDSKQIQYFNKQKQITQDALFCEFQKAMRVPEKRQPQGLRERIDIRDFIDAEIETDSWVVGRWLLENGLVKDSKSIERIQRNIQKDGKVLRDTVQSLRKSGIYLEDGQEILNRLRRYYDTSALPSVLMTFYAPAAKEFNPTIFPSFKVRTEDWYTAVTHIVTEYSAELNSGNYDKSNFAEFYKNHIKELYSLVILYHILGGYKVQEEERKKLNVPSAQECDNLKRRLVDLQKEAQTAKSEANKKNGMIRSLQQENERMREKILKLEKQLAHVSKNQAPELRKQLEAVQKENLALKKQLGTEPRNRCQSKVNVEKDSIADIDLPDSDVVFLGGHSRLINKLKQIYPGWTFINDDDYKMNTAGYPGKILFFWSNYISHGMQEKIYREHGKETPIVYVKSTNIELLQREMKLGYKAALSKF